MDTGISGVSGHNGSDSDDNSDLEYLRFSASNTTCPMNIPTMKESQQQQQQQSPQQYAAFERVELRPSITRLRREDVTTTAAANAKQKIPPISMQSIIQSLLLNDIQLSVVDIIKYAVVTLMVLIILLYLFPQQILMIMLLVLFILFLILYIAIQRVNIKNRRINLEKFERLRNERHNYPTYNR